MDLRHVVEIHSIHSGDERQRDENCRDDRQCLHHFVHGIRVQHHVEVNERCQHLSASIDRVAHLNDMIEEILQIDVSAVLDNLRLLFLLQLVDDLFQRRDQSSIVQHVALEVIDTLERITRQLLHQLMLDNLDLAVGSIDHVHVAVDDGVEQEIEEIVDLGSSDAAFVEFNLV